ncbi:Fimbrial assembly protein (PilN) [Herbaspirillum sp. CF444]|uniref:PilN domain-containing protein n=1 Tax=Herbaspirillum sp. CF444 TaxID=1144319 RepID=UPI0002723FFE|nr:PilN domain-containing protein [Herbaspirillum sp. CF444]EJL90067.1 Fimbrial assembly protein (PilN) [Herbaspirillum sp. CF444]
MQSLRINFVAVRSPWRWLGLMFLLAALIVAACEGRAYVRSSRELAAWEKSWRDLKQSERKTTRPEANKVKAGDRDQLQAELKAANRAISHLSLPWDALFREIESTMSDQVTLLSIEPDTERKEIRITAEAKDFNGVTAYARQLAAIPLLQDVYVMNHQVQPQDPQRPVRFVAVAKWLMTPDIMGKR